MFNGERLAELRKDKNLNQEECAKLLNISVSSLSEYERGIHAPSDETKINIAKLFDVSLDYLMELIDDEISYRRAHSVLTFKKNFPHSAISDIQKYIDYIYDAHKYRE